MTKTEARIIRNLYVFRWDFVALRSDYEHSAGEALEEHNLIKILRTEDEAWAQRLEVSE